jgi:short-subunit dehydrogenase
VLSSYAVNVVGAISAAQVFTPPMREARAGTFLATGGYAGVDPQPDYASLSLGKAGLRAAVPLLHKELKDDGVHAASVQVAGAIAPGTPMAPDRIAETYWALHAQPAAGWTTETVIDGQ